MIEARGIGKRFGRVVAVRGVDLEVRAGEVVGLVGENGAGKTTTLRIVTGYMQADEGRALVSGTDLAVSRCEAQRVLAYVPESAPLYPDMRVHEYLRFRARLKGVAKSKVAEAIASAMDSTQIAERSRWLISRLSKGWRQRVALADALVADPEVLVLDEPTAGLDPMQIEHFKEVIRGSATERAVLIASHVLSLVADVADRLVVLSGGTVVAAGTVDELREAAGLKPAASLEQIFASLVSRGSGASAC